MQLKDLIWRGVYIDFFKREEVLDTLGEHNIAALWNLVKKLFEDFWPNQGKSEMQGVESVIQEFHQTDPSGQKLRFDYDKRVSKQHTYEKTPQFISLENLKETLDGVFIFLTCCDSMLHDHFQNRPRE